MDTSLVSDKHVPACRFQSVTSGSGALVWFSRSQGWKWMAQDYYCDVLLFEQLLPHICQADGDFGVEEIHSVGTINNLKTSYSTQLHIVTYWQRFDVRRTSWSHLDYLRARWSTWPGNHLVPCVAELVGSRITIHAHRCLPDPLICMNIHQKWMIFHGDMAVWRLSTRRISTILNFRDPIMR